LDDLPRRSDRRRHRDRLRPLAASPALRVRPPSRPALRLEGEDREKRDLRSADLRSLRDIAGAE